MRSVSKDESLVATSAERRASAAWAAWGSKGCGAGLRGAEERSLGRLRGSTRRNFSICSWMAFFSASAACCACEGFLRLFFSGEGRG